MARPLSLWALAGLLAAAPAPAADFAVTDTADVGDALPGDGLCETPAGACTLRAAVQEANALPGPDGIALPAGVFALAIPGPLEDAAFTGDLDLLDDLSLAGAGADETVVDAAGLDRAFHLPLAGTSVAISGLTVRGGFAEAGGGILTSGVLELDGVVVRDCESTGIAGGINNFGQLVATRSAIVANRTLGNGGGIGNDGPSATMLLVDSEVRDNRAEADAGGFGGPGVHMLLRTRVAGNTANVLGGGSAFPPGGSLWMVDSTVEDNVGQQGGGLAFAGPTEIDSSTIANNVARGSGGGIAATSPRLHLRNTTISGNRATQDAGGIVHSTADFALRNVTITGNVTETGNGGGLQSRTPNGLVRNTIIAGNLDLAGGDAPDCSGSFDSEGHNLIGDPTGCGIGGDGPGDLLGADPLLGALADHGGPTRTHALLPGSPALDAGSDAPLGDAGACEAHDQRGRTRPQDGDADGGARCDIGAFELPEPGALPALLAGAALAVGLSRRRVSADASRGRRIPASSASR